MRCKKEMNIMVRRIISVILLAMMLIQDAVLVYASDSVVEISGFHNEAGKIYYYEDGIKAIGERYIEDEAGKWHWYYFVPEKDGEMNVGWAYIPLEEKWCYYDIQGKMMYGEQYIDNHWYLFDSYTGAVQYGFQYIEKDNKWVYYDRVMGWMLYGEQYIDGGWYYLTPGTGAVDYDWAWIPESDKWVYYDSFTGRMLYGEQHIDGKWEYFDELTGEVYSRQDKIDKIVNMAYSVSGQRVETVNPSGILAINGGKVCHYGSCMGFVWWTFYQSGLSGHFADGLKSGWPHENYDWFKSKGMVDFNPRAGDIVFFRYPYFSNIENVSCSHAGLVVGVRGSSVLVMDALEDGIRPRWYSIFNSYIVGFAHPWD